MVNGNIHAPFKVDLSGNYIKTLMRKQLLLLIFLAFGFELVAQQNYYIYIQSDKYQPFYVNLDKNILSSSDKGHIMISKLVDGVIEFTIGFPKNSYPEQKFHVALNKRDQGFQLKDFGEKGWGLFNLQTLAIIYNDDADKKKTAEHGERRNDNFSALLANVVNDSAVLYAMKKTQPAVIVQQAVKRDTISSMETNGTTTVVTGVVLKEEKEIEKPATTEAAKNTGDSIVQISTTPAKTEGQIIIEKTAVPVTEKKDTVVKAQAPPTSLTVKKLVERKRTDNYYMVFVDKIGNKTDTIRLSIPFEKDSEVKQPAQEIVIETAQPKKEPTQQIVIESAQPKKDSVSSSTNDATGKEPAQQIIVESAQPKKDSLAKDTLIVTSSAPAPPVKEPAQQIVIETPQVKKDTETKPSSGRTREDSITITSAAPKSKEPEPSGKEIPKTDTAAIQPGGETRLIRNSDCQNFATDNDVDKLRIKLIAEKTIDDKLLAAKKYFKTKCFEVRQVRALTELFPKDEDKYQLFDTAYPFISDTGNFSSLESLITDEYFKNRFKAMIRK